jgi:FKBP-type peptidyl-prolyl cis-trans isomerase FklB
MFKRWIWVAWVALACGTVPAANAVSLKSHKQQFSYTFGYEVASSLKQRGMDFDNAVFVQGVRDALGGRKSRLSQAQMTAAIERYQKERAGKAGASGLKAGNAYRARYRKEKGVKALPNGMLYRVIRGGTGARPKPTDTVTVNYSGKLVDGKVFDSSYRRGQPATFPLNGVIKGWQEILPMMKTGAKWEVVIPPDLAYGPSGSPPVIPPQSTLIFTIELLSIK